MKYLKKKKSQLIPEVSENRYSFFPYKCFLSCSVTLRSPVSSPLLPLSITASLMPIHDLVQKANTASPA